MPRPKPTTVDEYVKTAPQYARGKLQELRAVLKSVAPKAKETLKWGSPVFEDDRILFADAAFKTHVNFMPTPSAMRPFKKELAKFTTGKGSIQLPYDKPLPKALIRRIAAYRVKELREKEVRWM